MASFKQLSTTKYQSDINSKSAAELLHWKAFTFPLTVKENSAVTNIEFSPIDATLFAIAASASIKIYNVINAQPLRTFSKDVGEMYGGSFRQDGRLLIAGGEQGKVRVFNLDTKKTIRTFIGHSAAVHACKFTVDNSGAISFANDKKVIVWDLPGEVPLITYEEHKDYVQTGAVSKASNMFISGSYDHTIKMFDPRLSASVLTIDHGAPVESVLMFPSGGVLVSAGGLEIKVWDIIGGGRLIAKLLHHHKTVTSLSFASQGKRLLSGSLDRHVKIYDLNTYHVVHTFDFPSPILSVGIPDNDSSLVVGMSNGLLSVQKRPKEAPIEPEESSIKKDFKSNPHTIYINEDKRAKLPRHEDFLKHFEVTKALDHVIRHNANDSPEITMAVIQELFRRKAMKSAIAGGDNSEKITVYFKFILKHLSNPAYTSLMVDFGNSVLDVYNSSNITYSPTVKQVLKRLSITLKREIERMKDMMALSGAIELLLATSNSTKIPSDLKNKTLTEMPLTNNSVDE